MNKLIATIAFVFACIPVLHAQETIGDKAHEAKTDAVQAKRSVGEDIRHAGREIKASAKEARDAIVTRCGDGSHTIRGATGCEGHGGVVKSSQN